MQTCKKRGGFTAVELIVVLALFALIAALAVPFILNARQEAKYAGLPAEAKAICLAAQITANEFAQEHPDAEKVSFITSAIAGQQTDPSKPNYETKEEYDKRLEYQQALRDRVRELLDTQISSYAYYNVYLEDGKVAKIDYFKTVAGKDKTTTIEIGKGEQKLDSDKEPIPGAYHDLVTVIDTPKPDEKKDK